MPTELLFVKKKWAFFHFWTQSSSTLFITEAIQTYLKKPHSHRGVFFIRVMEEKRDMKIVSQIYRCLHPLVLGNALDIREKWELGMNVFTEGETCVKMGIR